MFVLAHLSDPHLAPLPQPRPTELASKRLLGFVNWHLRRHLCHRREVLDALTADMAAAEPDHIAITGDLINIALGEEFAPARAWLERIGTPDRVTLVPGNHDVYVRATAREAERNWGDFMRGDGAAPAAPGFPFVRLRGPAALIGLSTALPTAPFQATGRLGNAQLERLAALLPKLAAAGAFRVILIHHPPLGKRARHKRLVDAQPLLRVLGEHGAELILHGHDHLNELHWLKGYDGRVPVVGVPSASAATASRHDDLAAYNLYRIEGRPGAWRCEMVSRGSQPGGGPIVELARAMLSG